MQEENDGWVLKKPEYKGSIKLNGLYKDPSGRTATVENLDIEQGSVTFRTPYGTEFTRPISRTEQAIETGEVRLT